ncbi:MAG: hypothetical protein EAY81_04945 [Bacteroidetes bacterium]|nr:MAG: hypothetical protein EAY81_04945 [Bacteroidota bacterium]
MNYFVFWATFVLLAFLVLLCDKKYYMLRDTSSALPRPYSFSRVQLAWWTTIVLSGVITIIITKGWLIPDFTSSTLYLLGISGATTVGATLIDLSDQSNVKLTSMHQNGQGDNFFLDILSDKNGVSIHRFQTVAFNMVFGIWFVINFFTNMNTPALGVNDILPVFSDNNLVLLGLSSGLYTAVKATENRQVSAATTNPQ